MIRDLTSARETLEYLSCIDEGLEFEKIVVYRSGHTDFLNCDIKFIKVDHGTTSNAYNIGVINASAEYVTLLCERDIIDKNFLRYVTKCNNDYDMYVNSYSNELGVSRIPELRFINDRIDWRHISFTSIIVKRYLVLQVGGMDVKYQIANDVDLIVKLFRTNPRYWFCYDSTNFRQTGGNSDKYLLQGLKEVCQIYEFGSLRGWFFVAKCYFIRKLSYMIRRYI